MAKEQYPKKGNREVALKGRLRTADPPTTIAPEDFQKLVNLRYNGENLESISGQTKINTTATYLDLVTAMHFRKDFPASESHFVIAPVGNVVRSITAAIPGQGNASNISSSPAVTGNPRLSLGPNGSIAMCNGTDSFIWYGNEMPVGAFLDWDSVNDSYKYDYLDVLSNSTTSDYAPINHSYTDTVDANTMLLLHCENITQTTAFTDDSGRHTVTPFGHAESNSNKKFGNYGCSFDGTGDYLRIPDSADFDFSGGSFTIDFWLLQVSSGTIYYQETDSSNYIRIQTSLSGSTPIITFTIVSGGSSVVTLQSTIYTTTFVHVAIVENGDNYSLFLNGKLSAYSNDTDRAANYTGNVFIGAQGGATNEFTGYIDEFRVSNIARWTPTHRGFTPPTTAYGQTAITEFFIGSVLPIKGIKFYVKTANTTGALEDIYEWTGEEWSSVGSITDGTDGTVTLSQTGTMSFGSTHSTSKQKNINDVILYWYKVVFTNMGTAGEIYQVSVDCQMQQLKDLWDGVYRPADGFLMYDSTNSVYQDWTPNVLSEEIDVYNEGTYAKVGGLIFATDYLYVSSIERLRGVKIVLRGGFENQNACTLDVDYWDGSAWVSAGPVEDGTSVNNISFAQSGTITWDPPDSSAEFKTAVTGLSSKRSSSGATYFRARYERQELTQEHIPGFNNFLGVGTKSPSSVSPIDLYWYRISFTGDTGDTPTTAFTAPAGAFPDESAGVHIVNVKTIPAPLDCRGYNFPMYHDGSLLLCGNNDSEPEALIVSAINRPQVFNGEESIKHYLGPGDLLVAGASLSNQFGAETTKMAIICTERGTYKLVGEFPYEAHTISETDGCVAPYSMDVGEVEIAQGVRRKVAVWVAQRGVVISDGTFIKEISGDIRDKFDPKHSNYIGSSVLPTLYGKIDPVLNEYHLVVPDSAEWVYSFEYGKWFEIDRGSGAYLNGLAPAYDTNGVCYMYGFIPDGYVVRLENGTTFVTDTSTNNITSTVRLADIALYNSSIMWKSRINWSTLLIKTKSSTTSTVSETRYVDGENTGTAISTVDPTKSGYGYTQEDIHGEGKTGTFHSPEFSITTSDETVGFEPILWGCNYTVYEREK